MVNKIKMNNYGTERFLLRLVKAEKKLHRQTECKVNTSREKERERNSSKTMMRVRAGEIWNTDGDEDKAQLSMCIVCSCSSSAIINDPFIDFKCICVQRATKQIPLFFSLVLTARMTMCVLYIQHKSLMILRDNH